ncbi:MAG: tetratricopeptide repeat protein [Lachnospiraceae bacterium]|nr:tetratricopeptide repeat protein [Lachnospiraceae bacterium]
MGEMILCRRPIAATPFYIEETSLNIYSLEELSYYIAENVYLLDGSLMTSELCNWIGRELSLKDLERELLDMLSENAPLHVFIEKLLRETGYLTGQEIKNVTEIISSFENKSEMERGKIRSDRLFEKGKYIEAIYEYEALLSSDQVENAGEGLLGDIYHNLGASYGRLFFFSQSAQAFEKAYQHNRKEVSLRALLYTFKCMRDGDGFSAMVKKYHVPREIEQDVLSQIEGITSGENVTEFGRKVSAMERSGNPEDNMEITQAILEDWKRDYCAYCGIN